MDRFSILSSVELVNIVGGKKKKSVLYKIGDTISSYYKGYYKGLFGGK